jgi:hypothetical protein
MTSLLAHRIRLTLVFVHASVDNPVNPSASNNCSSICAFVLDDIRANRDAEDVRHGDRVLRGLAIAADDGYSWSFGHGFGILEDVGEERKLQIRLSSGYGVAISWCGELAGPGDFPARGGKAARRQTRSSASTSPN